MSNPDRIPRPRHLFPEAAAWLIQGQRGLLRAQWALREDHDWFPAWSIGSIAGVCGIMLTILLFFIEEPNKLDAAPSISPEAQTVFAEFPIQKPTPVRSNFPLPEPTPNLEFDQVLPPILNTKRSDLSQSFVFRTELPFRWDQRELATVTSRPDRINERFIPDQFLTTLPDRQLLDRFQAYLPQGAMVPIPPSYITSSVVRTTFDGIQPTRNQGIFIEKQTPPATSLGQPLTYTIHITNRTNDPIDQVVVHERLSAIHRVSKVDPPAAVQGDELVWSLGQLPAHGRRVLRVTLVPDSQVLIKTETTLQNKSRVGGIASISAPVEKEPELLPVEPEAPVVPVFEERKPQPAPDPVPVSNLPKPFPELKLAVTPVRAVKKGETISLTFTVTNVGTAPAKDISLYLRLSGEMKHKFGERVKHTISRLEPGQSHKALFQATARKSGNGRLSASLTMQGTEEEAEEFTIRIDSPPQGISRRSQKTSFVTERPTEPSLTSTQWKRFTE